MKEAMKWPSLHGGRRQLNPEAMARLLARASTMERSGTMRKDVAKVLGVSSSFLYVHLGPSSRIRHKAYSFEIVG